MTGKRASTSLFVIALSLSVVGPARAQEPEQPAAEEPAITALPTVKKFVEAIYPPKALEDRVQARVVLELDIGADGMVESANVVEYTITDEGGKPIVTAKDYGFDQAATVAASQLEFEPAQAGDQPVAVRINYTYNFNLPEAAPTPPATDASTTGPAPAPAPSIANFEGALLERGTRAAMAGITVTVFRGQGADADGYEAISDQDGRFQFFDLEDGEWSVLIEADGYYRFETSEVMRRGEQVDATYYLERRSYNPYDVLVEGERPAKEVNRRTLTSAEIVKVPGTLGDPIQVIENLPGVARSAPLSGEVIVRGSGPSDTGIMIDGSAVPMIYHFGGLRSVVPAHVVDSLDFYPGNYSVAYGRAMGGILDLNIKSLKPDRTHGSVDVSLLDTSLYLETPIGDDAAIAVAGRRSYVDFVLNAAIPEDAPVGLVNAPRYYDYQVLGTWRPRPSHELKAMFFGSDDRMELLFKDPGNMSTDLETGTMAGKAFFQRLNLEHSYTPSADYKNDLLLSLGRDRSRLDVFQAHVDYKVLQLTARDTSTWRLSDSLSLDAGVDLQLSTWSGSVLAPRPPEEGQPSGGEGDFDNLVYTEFEDRVFFYGAPFVEAEAKIGDLTLVPGLRADYFSRVDEFSVDPRITARYQLGDWTAKAGAAVVHQEPTPQQTDDAFGNPDLELMRAYQYSLGAEWKPREHLKIDVTGFYKQMDNLISPVGTTIERNGETVAQVYDNGGEGRVHGMEVFLEHQLSNNFRGWLTYSLSRAERRDSGAEEFRLFDYDQTHIFALVGSYLLPRNWELGVRWRFVTGSPTTPYVGGVFVSDDDEYAPVAGEANSTRLESFHQLDLRIDKSWVFDSWKMSTYLSLTNAYNRKNVEGVQYNFDYTQKNAVGGLPILPIVGIRGDF